MSKDKNSATWSSADDATLVYTLADQKAKGNWGDNNPKKIAWTACEATLEGSEKTSGGSPKTAAAIKNRWQRLKQEYEALKELRGMSGFGWDDTKKLVTAAAEVWDLYLAPRKNSPAKAFRSGKKTFPLYDDIGNLTDGTRATGANVFRVGQTPGPGHFHTRSPSPGPLYKHDPSHLTSPTSYDGFGIDPVLLAQEEMSGICGDESNAGVDTPGPKNQDSKKEPGYSFIGSDKYSSSEEAEEDTAPIKQGTSRKRPKSTEKSSEPRRKRRVTTGEGIADLSKSVHRMAGSVASAASKATRTPQALAIAKIQNDEEFTREEVVLAVKCVMRDPELANAYLALEDSDIGAEIMHEEIEKFRSRM